MTKSDDWLLVLGLGVLAWLLLGRPQPAPSAGPVQGPAASGGSGCDTCGISSGPAAVQVVTPGPVPATPPAAEPVPHLGSWENDAVLAEIIRLQEQYNQAGDWESAWAISRKRDEWIKSKGY